jgi:hypothetical protein
MDIQIFQVIGCLPELIIRRLLYAKKAFHRYNSEDQVDQYIHEKIIHNNFDKP